MPTILIASKDDWANVGYTFQRAFQAVDIDALAVSLHRHGFGYPNQAKRIKPGQIIDLARSAKGILLMHSQCIVPQPLVKKRFSAIFHGGSKYRNNPYGINGVFNQFVNATLIQTNDLLGFGARNEHWIIPPVNTNAIRPPRKRKPGKLRIAHYPRPFGNKGTDEIVRTIQKFQPHQFEFKMTTERVKWPQSLQRMSECDIYIESLCREVRGKPVGEWGITALEAAALGRIVITVFGGKEKYAKEYGPCPILDVRNGDDLEYELDRLIRMGKTKLRGIRRATRKWVCEYHSFEAIGERLKRIFEPCL